MSRFNNVDELPYTIEQLDYFECEMKKYRLPKYVQFWKRVGVWFIRNTFLPALVIIVVFGFLYMSDRNYGQRDWMWTLDKSIALFYIIGFGVWTLSSHFLELYSSNKLRKRLGLSKSHFRVMVIAFQITGMD